MNRNDKSLRFYQLILSGGEEQFRESYSDLIIEEYTFTFMLLSNDECV